MKEWLENLAPRERRVLVGGTVALVLLLFYLIIWQPLHTGVAQLRTSVAEQRDTLRWMRGVSLVPGTHGLIVGSSGLTIPVVNGTMQYPGH